MKLILRADVENLGSLGDIVTVKPGYGRNYLIPQGLAMTVTDANLKRFENERKKLEAKADSLRAAASELAAKIAACPITIEVRVGEGEKLYGSVTSANIAASLAENGLEIDRKKIMLDEPIRALGDFEIAVRLHPDVDAEIKLSVVRHGQPAEAPVADDSVSQPVDDNAQSDEQQESEPAE
ncbi:MAG: 50S ribosomal protein L9 [Desulfovibrionaceae bacterium]